jgi:hypothetical protein
MKPRSSAALRADHFFEHRAAPLGGVPAALDAVIRIEHVDDAGHARLGAQRRGSPVSVIAAGGAAVIRAIAREDLVAAGVHRAILIAFSFASAPPLVKKKTSMSPGVISASFAQPRARLGRHERVGVGERRRLLLDRADDALVAVADVHAHQLAVEVDEALAFRRPEVDALRARDRNRIDDVFCNGATPLSTNAVCSRSNASSAVASCAFA